MTITDRPVCFVLFFALLLCLAANPCSAARPAMETITEQGPVALHIHARSLVQGDAVMLRLEAPPRTSAAARFNGRDVSFAPSGDGGALFALLPLGLDLEEGSHPLLLTLRLNDGTTLVKPRALSLRRGTFPVTQLRVDPRFTAPSPDQLRRIEQERELVARLYGNGSSDWLGTGDFIRPLDGAVSSPFGVKRVFNDIVHSRHRGVDLRSPAGTPIGAANAGTVVLTRSLFFAGNTVIIDHGMNLFTIYCHLSDIGVSEGEPVEKGSVIGTVGATGRATGPHLHWGARLAGTHVDPLSLLELPFSR